MHKRSSFFLYKTEKWHRNNMKESLKFFENLPNVLFYDIIGRNKLRQQRMVLQMPDAAQRPGKMISEG